MIVDCVCDCVIIDVDRVCMVIDVVDVVDCDCVLEEVWLIIDVEIEFVIVDLVVMEGVD